MDMKKKRRGVGRCCFAAMLALGLVGAQFSDATAGLTAKTAVVQAAETKAAEQVADTLSPSIDTVLSDVTKYMQASDKNPGYTSQWRILGMVRGEQNVPQKYIDTFYNNVVKYLDDNKYDLNTRNYSDYSKLILSLTSIGIDAQDVNGHNLLQKLSDFSNVKLQGLNGPIWALLALNAHPLYSIPKNDKAAEQTTEDVLIKYILDKKLEDGGWAFTGTKADADITAMAMQALAPYYGKRDDVKKAIDGAISVLSAAQFKSGGFGTMSGTSTVETAESCAQVIVALCALDIDGAKDSRFIKSGKWPMTGLFHYYLPEGGFMHMNAEDDKSGSSPLINELATAQGMYATAAYSRFLAGKTSLYDMSDVVLKSGPAPNRSDSTTATGGSSTENSSSTTAGKVVKVKTIKLSDTKVSLSKGKTKKVTATVTPAKATNPALTWTSSDKKIATVSASGRITAVAAGTCKVTAKAKDGSGVKAVVEVTVTSAITKPKTETVVITSYKKPTTTTYKPTYYTTSSRVTTTAYRPSTTAATTAATTASSAATTTASTLATTASAAATTLDPFADTSTDYAFDTTGDWAFEGEDYDDHAGQLFNFAEDQYYEEDAPLAAAGTFTGAEGSVNGNVPPKKNAGMGAMLGLLAVALLGGAGVAVAKKEAVLAALNALKAKVKKP